MWRRWRVCLCVGFVGCVIVGGLSAREHSPPPPPPQTLAIVGSLSFDWPLAMQAVFSAAAASTLTVDLVAPDCAMAVGFVRRWAMVMGFGVGTAGLVAAGAILGVAASLARCRHRRLASAFCGPRAAAPRASALRSSLLSLYCFGCVGWMRLEAT